MMLFGFSDETKAFIRRIKEGLGDEMTENGEFDGSADGWSLGSGWLYSNNKVSNISNLASFISQDITFVSGVVYKITYTVSQFRRGFVHSSISGGGNNVSGSFVGGNGTFIDYLESTGNNSFRITSNEEFYGSIENVSIKALVGSGTVESAKCIDEKLNLK